MALAWTVFAGFAAWEGFAPIAGVFWGLMITSIYLLGAGALQQVLHGQDG
jgi:phosphatidylcholine synthase